MNERLFLASGPHGYTARCLDQIADAIERGDLGDPLIFFPLDVVSTLRVAAEQLVEGPRP